jgi:hypothetical protein
VLCVGIGGGGDVVGALAVARVAKLFGAEAVVGGTTWERRPVDPVPGPRRLDELEHAEPLNDAVALAGPQTGGPGGFLFAESHMARVLGEKTVLVDLNPGPAAVGAGLADAARRLHCDAIALVDVGGDVLAHGSEPGLASPLCDAVLLAAAAHVDPEIPVIGAIFGVGCDGELTPEEVLERIAELAAAGTVLGSWGITPADADALEAAVAEVPTEASAQALACARGAYGLGEIRQGRRHVPRSPLGAVTFFFDARAALAAAVPLAQAVLDAADLAEADARLAARGIRTELAYERDAAGST